ncbi:hypothetical protein QUW15_01940 [Desulfovibrio piger]|nr:hypothetical protein [Desulfovibrio piger]
MKNAFFAAAACLLLAFCCAAGHVHAEEAPVADDGAGLCGGDADATVLDELLLAGRGRGMAACPESAITGAWSVMTGR